MGALLALPAAAQETSGEAEIGFQQHILNNGNQRGINAAGLLISVREYLPKLGLFTANLFPAANNGQFRPGESYLELKHVPWAKYYWTVRGGDFLLPGQFLDTKFNNLYYPAITGRGAWVEASHAGRTMGFFYGAETLQYGSRISLRVLTPQKSMGAYIKQEFGKRLVVGIRAIRFSTDLARLDSGNSFAVYGPTYRTALTSTVYAQYTAAKSLKFYSEATYSGGVREGVAATEKGPSVSYTVGPVLDTKRLTVKANYVYQTESYMPMLGYSVGDRTGPYAEVQVKPVEGVTLYGSASAYSNNVAHRAEMPTFHSQTVTAGATVQLPGRFLVTGQWTSLDLDSRKNAESPWLGTRSQQRYVSLSKQLSRHYLRLSAREYRQSGVYVSQRQRNLEVADRVRYRWFVVGGEARFQRTTATVQQTTLYFRGSGQVNVRRFSAYANVEHGNDLASRSLLTLTATRNTIFGGSAQLGKDWDLNVEAYRIRLLTELNPLNVFVLQGQGVEVPTLLSALNQWSFYLRMTRRFRWGKPVPTAIAGLDSFASAQTQLKGTIEGFVTSGPNQGVEGIPVELDGSRVVMTAADGRYRFDNVDEGARKVALAMSQLPAEYDPGAVMESVTVVQPGRASRADLNVVMVGHSVLGTVAGPLGTPYGSIVVKLLPTERTTTPDSAGNFGFHNIAEGNYELVLATESLPEHSVLTTPGRIPVAVPGTEAGAARFAFDVKVPAKPVRVLTLPPQVPRQK